MTTLQAIKLIEVELIYLKENNGSLLNLEQTIEIIVSQLRILKGKRFYYRSKIKQQRIVEIKKIKPKKRKRKIIKGNYLELF